MTSRKEEVLDDTDIELCDVGLLDQQTQSGNGDAQTWYSAHGRGFSVNGTQTETRGGISHVTTVLGEGFYSRERRKQQIWEFMTEKPSKAFNISSVVLAATTIILGLSLIGSSSRGSAVVNSRLDAKFAPEGALGVDIAQSYDYRGKPRSVQSSFQAVAADHGRCSDLGLNIMEQGGNAMDAMVTTALCQGIMNPVASGIGGGGFILVRLSNGTTGFVDAREIAPAAANATMYEGYESASSIGGMAVAVPLELKGLWMAHRRFGNMSWHALVEPAAELARKGFPTHPYMVDKLTQYKVNISSNDAMREDFLIKEGKGWRPPRVNETCCSRPQLASLLDDVALSGPAALYETKKADDLAREVQEAGGILTAGDLRSAQPYLRPALRVKVYGVEVVGPPPPSSAAVIMAALHILQGYALRTPFAGPLIQHWLVEAMKSAFALRTHLGDPGLCSGTQDCFLDLDSVLNDTLSEEYADSLRSGLLDNSTQDTERYGGSWHATMSTPEDHGTTHISIVDRHRMAVSMTTSVNFAFGSFVYSKSTGILLNNQMDDFAKPGQSDALNMASIPANLISPGKKPLSSMSPLILSDDSGLRAVVGAGGGKRIVTAVLTAIYRMLALGQDPLAAISSPRLHHQLLPDTVAAEAWNSTGSSFVVSSETVAALRRRGHQVSPSDWGAVCQAVVINPETDVLTAASDPRKDGAPAGS